VLVLAIGGVIGALRGSPGVAVEKERSSAVAPHGSSLAGAPSLSGAASSAPLPSPDPAPEELEKAVAGGLVPLQKLAAGFPESATVLLEIGRAQVAKKDYVAGVLAVARALEIDPEMRRDPRTAGVLFQAAQAKVASAAAFKLLEGPMRERGAAIEHDLAVYAPTGSLAQKHAEAFLRSPRFTAVAEPPFSSRWRCAERRPAPRFAHCSWRPRRRAIGRACRTSSSSGSTSRRTPA
jgi:hypothetical protein